MPHKLGPKTTVGTIQKDTEKAREDSQIEPSRALLLLHRFYMGYGTAKRCISASPLFLHLRDSTGSIFLAIYIVCN